MKHLKIYENFMKNNWIEIEEGDYHTYPGEGIEVLVSDGTNHDVAYYIMSCEYKWLKVDVKNDNVYDFENFIPIKWKLID